MPELRIRDHLAGPERVNSQLGGALDLPINEDGLVEPNRVSLEWLFGVMCWPGDEQARRELVHFQHFRALQLMDKHPELESDQTLQFLLKLHRESLGGWGALINTGGDSWAEIARKSRRADLVGATLWVAYLLATRYPERIRGGVSLRRVWDGLYRTGDQWFQHPPSKDSLKEAWNEYKTVAHLWAAQFFFSRYLWRETLLRGLGGPTTSIDSDSAWSVVLNAVAPEWVKVISVLGHRIQTFGLSYKPPRSRTPFLDGESLWLLTDIPDWSLDLPTVDLSDDLLEAFDDY